MSMLFFAGPAHVGQSLTYRVTSTTGAQAASQVATLILTWTAPTRIYARIAGSGPKAAVEITRADDGSLSVTKSNSSDARSTAVATLLDQLNYPGMLAASLSGSDHMQTTLTIVPPTPTPSPASTSTPASQKSPAPVVVPVILDLVTSDASYTLMVDGNNTNHNSSSDSGSGRRGGGMGGAGGGMGGGGWHSRGSNRNRNGSTTPVDVALDAIFDQSGSLEHATFRETFGSTAKGAQPIEDTITIDRTD